jgi:2'-5' RNA ligase
MSNQELLPGFEPSLPTDRLFLAIFPELEHAIQLETLAAKHLASHRLGSGAVESDRLHVTLFHLGDYVGLPPDLTTRAKEALSRLTASAFTIRFDQIGSFGNRQSKSPLVLTASEGNEALHALHKQLATYLRASALGQHTRGSFEPHMTMAYGKATVPFEKVAPISWPAREVVLIHSLLGKTRHIRLASKLL